MGASSLRRPDPEQLLRRVEAAEAHEHSGRLKIFLGYASGVGKSFRMIDEGRRRRERGQDVVVGAIQPDINAAIARLLQQIEIIPLKQVGGVPIIDLDTILRRHPQVCLVDGLAYDNPAGSPRASRWQDVEVLLEAGISVITSINLGFILEHREEVARITGKRAGTTVPVAFIREADEIVVVDAPPDACLDKESGAGQTPGDRARELAELREIALILAADVVERQLEGYLERNGVKPTWGTQERILVCLTPRANGRRMVESGRRIADGFHGELLATYVKQEDLNANDKARLEENLELAKAARAEIVTLEGGDPVECILNLATQRGITQIFVGHSMREGWKARLLGGPLDRLLKKSRGMDVRVFPH